MGKPRILIAGTIAVTTRRDGCIGVHTEPPSFVCHIFARERRQSNHAGCTKLVLGGWGIIAEADALLAARKRRYNCAVSESADLSRSMAACSTAHSARVCFNARRASFS